MKSTQTLFEALLFRGWTGALKKEVAKRRKTNSQVIRRQASIAFLATIIHSTLHTIRRAYPA